MADNEQLILSISADTRAMQRQLDKLVGQIGVVDNSLGNAFTKAPKKIDDVAKSLGGAKFQTANLAAQFQDIAVQLQGGQSPFTVALQQGTQISQVLGQGGAAGAVSLLSSAFASLLTPTSLATIATIALGGAAVQYVSKALGGVGDLDDKLKAHSDLIKSLRDSYGEAGKGVDTAVKEAAAVLKTLLGFKTDDIKKEFQSLSVSISKSLSDFRITGLGPAIEENSRKFSAFSDEITAFKTSVKNGTPDVLAFRRAIQEIADSTSDEKTRDLAKELLDLTSKAGTAQLAIEGTSRALRNFDATALAAAQQGEAFADAMKKLSGTVTPNLDDREKILKNYLAALEQAGSTEERLAVVRERDNQLAILSYNERKKAAEDAASAQEQALKSFQNQINSQSKQNARTLGAAAGFDAGIGELTRLETQYKLTEAAQQAFKRVTPEVAAEIDKVATAAGNAAAELAKARVVANTDFAVKTAFLTPEDLAIAQQLRGIYGNDVPAALASTEAAGLRAAYALQQISQVGQDITRSVLADFTQQIRNGASAMDALKTAGLNALSKLSDKLAQMAADNLWNAAFGGSGGGFNLASLFGGGGSASAGPITLGGPSGPVPFFASGTNYAPGGMAVVGRRGQSWSIFLVVLRSFLMMCCEPGWVGAFRRP